VSRLLITGGSGYLGRHLVPLAATSHKVTYTYFHHDPLHLPFGQPLDVRDEPAVRRLILDVRPDAIIHTVGSNRTPDMDLVIRQGAHHVTQAAADAGARLIHISTDVIFDGRSPPYDETAPPAPLHLYGRAKAAAEKIVASHPDHIIIRTSLIYGLGQMDHGTAWVVNTLAAGQPVVLFTNQYRNPVWVESLCRACLELAENDYRGILNVAGTQSMSRAEFVLKMLDWWGVGQRDTLAMGLADSRRWPLDCRLDLRRASAVLRTPLLGVDAVLRSGR